MSEQDHDGGHQQGHGKASEPEPDPAHGAHDHEDTMGFHGMVALGTRDIYLTHLAMRSGPHMFQVLCRVHFEATPQTRVSEHALIEAGTADPTEVYRQDRVSPDNPMKVYTVAPTSDFELADLATGQMDRFSANVIRGHFERDDRPVVLLENVTAVVDALIYSSHLRNPQADEESPRANGTVPHLLFGAGDEFFVCHRISLHGELDKATDCGYHQVFPLRPESALDLAFERRDGIVEISTDVINLASSGRLSPNGGQIAFDLSRLTGKPRGTIVSELDLGPEHYLEILMG